MNIWRVEYYDGDTLDEAWIVPAGSIPAAVRKALAKSREQGKIRKAEAMEIMVQLLHKNMTWEEYKSR